MRFIEKPERYTICRDDSVRMAGVYEGGFGWLRPAQLRWRVEEEISQKLEHRIEVLTLKEISEQLKAPIITVFLDDPFVCTVLQYGNYGDEWVHLGTLAGYA